MVVRTRRVQCTTTACFMLRIHPRIELDPVGPPPYPARSLPCTVQCTRSGGGGGGGPQWLGDSGRKRWRGSGVHTVDVGPQLSATLAGGPSRAPRLRTWDTAPRRSPRGREVRAASGRDVGGWGWVPPGTRIGGQVGIALDWTGPDWTITDSRPHCSNRVRGFVQYSLRIFMTQLIF